MPAAAHRGVLVHRTFMVDRRRCCLCRRGVLLSRARYMGMLAHRRCVARRMAELDAQAPFSVQTNVRLLPAEGAPDDDHDHG